MFNSLPTKLTRSQGPDEVVHYLKPWPRGASEDAITTSRVEETFRAEAQTDLIDSELNPNEITSRRRTLKTNSRVQALWRKATGRTDLNLKTRVPTQRVPEDSYYTLESTGTLGIRH